MKKRFLSVLTIVLSAILLLAGCGGSANNMLSKRLSEEKIIAYKVESVDKEETPEEIFFFDKGKVSVMEGSLLGLTMGDYAKMSDREIWEL